MDTMDGYRIKINTKKEGKTIIELREKISQEVIGQDRAIRRLLRATSSYFSGLNDPRRPIGGFIFAGPTGVGKTFCAKVFARHFLGGSNRYRDYLTRIDCSALNQSFEVSKLKGAPPGYIGYGESNLLAQENIDNFHFDVKVGKDDGLLVVEMKDVQNIRKLKIISKEQQGLMFKIATLYNTNRPYKSIILFDEIEKAHSDIWNILLQIMEEGKLQMGESNKETSFTNSVIMLTTNLGQRKIQDMFEGKLGFSPNATDVKNKDTDQEIYETVKSSIQKTFPPELFKRLDLIVFRPLEDNDYTKILDNFLIEEQERLDQKVRQISRFSIKLNYTNDVKRFLLEKGIDIKYGVRTLRAIIEKYVQSKISNGISSGEIRPGDEILIDEQNGDTVFLRKHRKRGQNAIKKHINLKDSIENRSKDITALIPENCGIEETEH